MTDYFDASALAAILFNEPSREVIDAHITASEASRVASDFVVAEVSSAVSRLVRTGVASVESARLILSDLDEWVRVDGEPIEIEPADIRDATLLVRRFELKLRAPDALHLAVSRRIGARLVTLDINLARAARTVELACINPADPSAT